MIRTFAVVALFCLPLAAAAQSYPNRPIRLIVPYAPGGATDVLARPIAQKLGEQLGQPIIVENRPGANTVIGAEQMVRAAPDGYTFMLGSVVQYMLPFFQKSVPFDPLRDFTPISQVAVVPNVLAVNASLPIHSVKDLIEYAKKPGVKLHYGTTGTGSTHHLGGIFLAQSAGIPLEHVPYKGGNPAMQDALAGSIPLLILTATTIMPQVKNGKLRALGLIENRRFDLVPGVPTIGETVPGYAVPDTWFGFAGPAGLPRPIVERLNAELRKAVQEPELQKRIENLGMVPTGTNSPDQVAASVRAESEAIRRIVTAAGIQPE
ncbi:MAG: Bug family tripartite tricarboxylate transporter substrate binding protein [Betaproteobacteria bacterium]